VRGFRYEKTQAQQLAFKEFAMQILSEVIQVIAFPIE